MGPDEAVHLVDDLRGQAVRRRHDREPQDCPLPLLLETDLGRRDAEAPAGTVEQRLDHLPLVLERLRRAHVQLDFVGQHEHGSSFAVARDCERHVRSISRSSKVSMRSPCLRSWKSDRPMPHSKPSRTSRTSALKRLSEEMLPFQMMTPSRRKRTLLPRVMTPERT